MDALKLKDTEFLANIEQIVDASGAAVSNGRSIGQIYRDLRNNTLILDISPNDVVRGQAIIKLYDSETRPAYRVDGDERPSSLLKLVVE